MEFCSFSLTDTSHLTDLIIGSDETNYNCYSFYCCRDIKLMNLSSLQTLEFGSFSFCLTNSLTLTGVV